MVWPHPISGLQGEEWRSAERVEWEVAAAELRDLGQEAATADP